MPRKKTFPWKHKKTDKDSEPKEFTKLSNLFLDNSHLFSLTEKAVYPIIARRTTGHHVESAMLSASEIARVTAIDRNAVSKALKNLELKGWIICIGLGPRGAKIYKITLLESLDDLKPLKRLPNKADLPTEQTKADKSEGTDLLLKTAGGAGTDLLLKTAGAPPPPVAFNSRWEPVDHYKKETLKKTTTTSQLSPKSKTQKPIPQKLINELPKAFRADKGVLKLLHDALNGELVAKVNGVRKKIKAKDIPTLIKNIRYIKAIVEGGQPIVNYNGYLCSVIANEWEAKPVAVSQKNEEEKLVRKAESDAIIHKLDENERIVKAERDADKKLLIEIKALPSEELGALKNLAFEVMPKFDKNRYSTSTESLKKSILERNMIKAYKKSHRAAV